MTTWQLFEESVAPGETEDENDDDSAEIVQPCVLLDCREFFVRKRHVAREAHAHALLRREAEFRRRRPDDVRRREARLQR